MLTPRFGVGSQATKLEEAVLDFGEFTIHPCRPPPSPPSSGKAEFSSQPRAASEISDGRIGKIPGIHCKSPFLFLFCV